MKKHIRNEKLQEKQKIKGQKMQQLARSKNVVIYQKVNKHDLLEHVVCLIYRITYNLSAKCNGSLEYFLTRESGKDQTIWIHGDYNSAFNQFKKLVNKLG